ncbi:glycosyltransferase family 9 protein [Streptomyces cinereospinus]|uniref:Glycosyltransferase family 9 protein n=1 Tax=Streptomyces cinereospinus TaxID=285561 RepID=A0ABV5MWD6_9ACTN
MTTTTFSALPPVRPARTGGPEEAALTRYVSGGTAIDLGGRTDARRLSGVLRAADAVVAGTGGAVHLAAANGTPVVSLVPPAATARTPGPARRTGGPARPGRRHRTGRDECRAETGHRVTRAAPWHPSPREEEFPWPKPSPPGPA